MFFIPFLLQWRMSLSFVSNFIWIKSHKSVTKIAFTSFNAELKTSVHFYGNDDNSQLFFFVKLINALFPSFGRTHQKNRSDEKWTEKFPIFPSQSFVNRARSDVKSVGIARAISFTFFSLEFISFRTDNRASYSAMWWNVWVENNSKINSRRQHWSYIVNLM